jgi:hypothetical protein
MKKVMPCVHSKSNGFIKSPSDPPYKFTKHFKIDFLNKKSSNKNKNINYQIIIPLTISTCISYYYFPYGHDVWTNGPPMSMRREVGLHPIWANDVYMSLNQCGYSHKSGYNNRQYKPWSRAKQPHNFILEVIPSLFYICSHFCQN